jgi:hypothetical protein
MLSITRRDLINLLGGTAAWPVGAGAQQPAIPVIGFLHTGTPEITPNLLAGFRNGLAETGYIEGRNVRIEYRWANNNFDRLPELAADLVRQRVSVIAAANSQNAALAAKAATTTIPIVFGGGADPVQVGLVASFNRPGGNVTGLATMSGELGAKRLGLLHDLLPGATRIGVLVNFENPSAGDALLADLKAAASTMNLQIEVLAAGDFRLNSSIQLGLCTRKQPPERAKRSNVQKGSVALPAPYRTTVSPRIIVAHRIWNGSLNSGANGLRAGVASLWVSASGSPTVDAGPLLFGDSV